MFRNDYNENEGITPTIDIENEEMSDDIDGNEVLGESYIDDDYEVNEELEEEYERMTIEFNESDEDQDNRENENDTREEIIGNDSYEIVVDQPLSSEQLPHSIGDFAPYFKNITESLFF